MSANSKLLRMDNVLIVVEDLYRLCFLRGPEGITIGLAEPLSKQSGTDVSGNS